MWDIKTLSKPRAGFTMVEIMIVVSIIALLAALLVPNLLYARMNATEAVVQGTLKNIASACESYRSAQTIPRFSLTLAVMINETPQYLDATIDTAATGNAKNGYNYTYTRINFQQFICCATPFTYRGTGVRTFAINEAGQVRAIDNGGAVVNTIALYNAMTSTQ